MLTVRQDQIICEAGSANKSIYVIAEGSVAAQFGNHYLSLGKGDVVGIFGITRESHLCTYQAESDTVLIPYQIENTDELLKLLEEKEDLRKFLLNSMNAHICDFFDAYSENIRALKELHQYVLSSKTRYQTMCKILHFTPKALPFSEELDLLSSDDKLDFWMNGYYNDMKKVMNTLNTTVSATFTYGYLDKSCKDLSTVVSLINDMEDIRQTLAHYLLNEDYIDFYDLYSDLFLRTQANGGDTASISNLLTTMAEKAKSLGYVSGKFVDSRAIRLKSTSVVTTSAVQGDVDTAIMQAKLSNSLGEILEFASVEHEIAADFKKTLEDFKALPDKDSSDPEASGLRKKITQLFNIIYAAAMQAALSREDIPTIIKMFLNFGFVDTDTCGNENSIMLYKLAENYHGHKEQGVYTILEWFQAIYRGEKIPSRNEFEVDYVQYVRNLVREGKIDKTAEGEMLNNGKEKVNYELNNMFASVNKMTTGRLFTFCPILLESTMLRSVNDLLLKPTALLDALDKINSIDYSAFYHEAVFEDTKIGVKEMIRYDIRPEFILMPNVGTRGVMWQEIEGLNRRTPARMFISAFYQDNLDKAIMRMTAEFRWEMCKRDMGARWNDVTTHSLTGDYCDYAQFFSKNRDLTADAKEKIKAALKRSKNSFKEMFVYDYMQYITYESAGSCRLNKVARSILFRFCPMSAACRDILANNAVFEECLSKHRISSGQALHRLEMIDKKYQTSGKSMPNELVIQKELVTK
ncbi:MAG: cyclic nucleotide-binding domain-containing protein [Lachnospiraceae bacterium]|nr:cyclic nucleotide-binding domain-containing protein [Candidatus Colinaster scatohippi]